VILAAWLLALLAIVHVASADIAAALGHSAAAWDTVLYGVEAGALWLYVAVTARLPVVTALAAWGVFESVQRAGCRLLHPMDTPVRLAQGEYLCDAAGVSTSWLSIVAVCCLAVVVRWRIW
jgi:hypothetical protein